MCILYGYSARERCCASVVVVVVVVVVLVVVVVVVVVVVYFSMYIHTIIGNQCNKTHINTDFIYHLYLFTYMYCFNVYLLYHVIDANIQYV